MMKLKALTIFVCSSMAGYAIADNMMENDTQNGQPTTMAPANGMNNGQSSTKITTMDHAELINMINTTLADYAGKVDVSIMNSTVFLKGELPSDTDYEKVVTLVESIKGVKDVNAHSLTVKDSNQPMQDIYITSKVKGALIREDVMGKDIPSWTIGVETKNGKVFLSGTVANEQEKQKVADVVKDVSGVMDIDNKIVVGNVEPANGTDGNIMNDNNNNMQ